MSRMIEIDFRPDERTLRQFGWIALVGFGLLAGLAWSESLVFRFGLGELREPVSAALAALGGLSLLFTWIYPQGNWPLFVGLSLLTYPIGWVLSYVIMGTLFYLMLAPLGMFFRLTGRDPMNRRFEPEAETYWVDAPGERARERYFRQF